MIFDLQPVLGSFVLDPEKLETAKHGGRNSTRWIIDIRQMQADVNAPVSNLRTEALAFWLVRGGTLQDLGMFSFSFGPRGRGFYDARPALVAPKNGGLVLTALNVDAEYQLSIDVMHSMHR